MAIDDLLEAYAIKAGHPDRAPAAIIHDLLVTLGELEAAEREIERLKGKISAGYIRRDVSSHYAEGWTPEAPLPDAVTDEWVKTGREAA
jgi:hypothetical protein